MWQSIDVIGTKKDRLVLRTTTYRCLMLPSKYADVITHRLSARDYSLLTLVITVLQVIRDGRLETVAEALPLPILFESRRKKCNAF